MTFYVQGLSAHELMPLNQVFKNFVVENTEAIISERAINEKERPEHRNRQGHRHSVVKAYQSVSVWPKKDNIVLAEQIMVSPVAVLELWA